MQSFLGETLLFFLGGALGSFLNVIALRYDPEKFLIRKEMLFGRSYCPHCRGKLRWFELVPFLSFLIQRGRCRRCKARLSPQYFLAEVSGGVVLLSVYLRLGEFPFSLLSGWSVALWSLVFATLLLITLIDIRFHIIPDEANVLLAVVGLSIALFAGNVFVGGQGSFVGPYVYLFGYPASIWLNRGLGALLAGAFFGFLVLITRGRSMGIGDLKLGVALGVVFGWPDILLIIALGFIFGSIYGLIAIASKKRSIGSFVPFGPFLALSALVTFLFGEVILRSYFGLIPL
ncbi:prepilin peptidase [Candidatus Parcubacteria bacterium]|nr:MAG: prepilin peptidase [Candidatus Parcubacteria bacterium]